MVSRSDPGSFQRTTTCIWMPDVRLLHYFEPTQWGSVSGLDDGKRKTKRGWSPGDSLNLVRVLSVRVNYSQQCRNDINGRWEYSKSIITFTYFVNYNWRHFIASEMRPKYVPCGQCSHRSFAAVAVWQQWATVGCVGAQLVPVRSPSSADHVWLVDAATLRSTGKHKGNKWLTNMETTDA